jgi:hypothetical protein
MQAAGQQPPAHTHTHTHTRTRATHTHTHTQADLESIRSFLLQRKGALINLTGDQRALSAAAAHVDDLLSRLPEAAAASGSSGGGGGAGVPLLPRVNEALAVPTQVRAWCARSDTHRVACLGGERHTLPWSTCTPAPTPRPTHPSAITHQHPPPPAVTLFQHPRTPHASSGQLRGQGGQPV